jgi:hypothetical protein
MGWRVRSSPHGCRVSEAVPGTVRMGAALRVLDGAEHDGRGDV